MRHLEEVHDDELLFADCEGDNFLPDLSRMWLLQIAQGPRGEIVAYADQPGFRPIREGLEKLRKAKKVVFHNGMGFDLFAINKLYPDTLRWEQMIDTLVISRLLNSKAKRHSLADIGDALGYPKGDFHEFDRFSKAMVKYGIQDVKILQKAWLGESKDGKRKFKAFGKFYHKYRQACELEFQTAYIIQKQTMHGFRFLYEDALKLEADMRVEQKELEDKFQEIFPPIVTERYSDKQIDNKTGKPKRLKDRVEVFNPGSRDQIGQRLIDKYGWKPVDLTKTKKPKIDETILGNLPYPEAQHMAKFLKTGKKLGMLADGANAWLKLAEEKPDGTFYIHGQVNTLGARTHRMSHFKPNVAQADKDYRMRSLFVADPDWHIVGVDAEGLELRELAHFLHPYDNGRYVEIVHSGDKSKGTDIHTVNKLAAKLFIRDSAKTMIYAHNYGCFDKKLGLIVYDDIKTVVDALSAEEPTKDQLKIIAEVGDRIDLEGAKRLLESQPAPSTAGAALRKNIEVGIVGLGDLIKKCKKAHSKFEALPGHDGRWIPSASDHSALNTLLQGNGSVVMKQALNVFDDEMGRLQLLDQMGYCVNCHDEYQITCHPDITDKVAEVGKWAISRAGEILELRCPLVGDAQVGKNWAETH